MHPLTQVFTNTALEAYLKNECWGPMSDSSRSEGCIHFQSTLNYKFRLRLLSNNGRAL